MTLFGSVAALLAEMNEYIVPALIKSVTEQRKRALLRPLIRKHKTKLFTYLLPRV